MGVGCITQNDSSNRDLGTYSVVSAVVGVWLKALQYRGHLEQDLGTYVMVEWCNGLNSCRCLWVRVYGVSRVPCGH
jgi:hypothetical protein